MAKIDKMMNVICKATGVSKHVPITHLNSPTVFETKDGQVGAILAIQGVSVETQTRTKVNQYQQAWHHGLAQLGEDYAIYAHIVREKQTIQLPARKDAPAFCQQIEKGYMRQFQEKELYQNRLYLTVLYKGAVPPMKGGHAMARLFKSLSKKTARTQISGWRERAMTTLEKGIDRLWVALESFGVRRVGLIDDQLGYSEVIYIYSRFVNGGRAVRLPNDSQGAHLFIQGNGDKGQVAYPHGNLSQFVGRSRIEFGHCIAFRDPAGDRFGRLLSIKRYGEATLPIMFDRLLHIDAECVITHTFMAEPRDKALGRVKRRLKQLENANDDAISEQQQLVGCQDDIASSRLVCGYHHHTILLLTDDPDRLPSITQQALRVYYEAQCVPLQEMLGQEGAFFAQLPGNQALIARRGLITSENLSDMYPLHNYQMGHTNRTHLGVALTLVETPSKTPLFFNYHDAGTHANKDDLRAGHSAIIGSNGTGKTMLMAFTGAQMQTRYGGRTFYFDRDQGLEIFVRANRGVYWRLHPDYCSNMNPLQLEDSKSNRTFLLNWLCQLIAKEGEVSIDASIREQLKVLVDYNFVLHPEHRRLSIIQGKLPMGFVRRIEIDRWWGEGEYAYLFDHGNDDLTTSVAISGFDLTHLMAEKEPAVISSTMMYLMHRIEQSLTGDRVTIFIDEGWMVLSHPYWVKHLRELLPTLRKYNAHIVLATQTPEKVLTSPISEEFLGNARSMIFGCNPNADYEKVYQHFNINPREFRFLKETPIVHRQLLYKQGDWSTVMKLNLSGMDDEMAIMAGNKSTIRLCQQIRDEIGDDPDNWIPIFHQRRKAAPAESAA